MYNFFLSVRISSILHTHTHTHTHSHAHTHPHPHVCAHTHAHITHLPTHTHTHTHTPTHTHTNTQTRSIYLSFHELHVSVRSRTFIYEESKSRMIFIESELECCFRVPPTHQYLTSTRNNDLLRIIWFMRFCKYVILNMSTVLYKYGIYAGKIKSFYPFIALASSLNTIPTKLVKESLT